jgi:valyl-tRNA synthetase
MPFITEEIYSALPRDEEVLISSQFPVFEIKNSYPSEEAKNGRYNECDKGNKKYQK